MASLVWFGVVLAVLQSMSTVVSKQLMRYSGIQRLKGTKTALFTAKISLIVGVFMNVAISPLLDMGSLAFISQAVKAPLQGLAIVWNTLAAPYTLGEILNLPDVIGCVLIFGGALATSLFGLQGDDQEYTLESLKKQFFRWVVLVYITLLGLWLVFNVLVLQPRSAAPKGEPFQTGDKLRGLSLGLTAGTLVGSQFCLKAFVEVLQASIRDDKPEYWADWFPYILLVGAVVFATSNIYFLTTAMREYKALLVVPLFEASVILSSCVSGSVVLSALHGLEWWKLCLYWLSLSLLVAGIGTVAHGSALKDKAARRNVGVTEVQDQDPGKIAEASDGTDDHVAVGTAHDPDKIQNPAGLGSTSLPQSAELAFQGPPTPHA